MDESTLKIALKNFVEEAVRQRISALMARRKMREFEFYIKKNAKKTSKH